VYRRRPKKRVAQSEKPEAGHTGTEGTATEGTEITEKNQARFGFLNRGTGVLSSVSTVSSVAISSSAELEIHARRLIARRHLHGVDKNPLAAEMAKLSLWLVTLAKDKPFEFLDHSIRCGDSLVGLESPSRSRNDADV
jgi:hypothetical protein